MAKKQTIVGSPLNPKLLSELGAVDEFPSTPEDFKPSGNWANTYRIWTCHGYRESSNDDVGFLRIKKNIDANGEIFDLHIEQTVVQTDAMLSNIEAQITCLNNEYASPVKWQTSSRFSGPDGKLLKDLCTAETVSVEGRGMTIETPAGILQRRFDSDRPLTSDWSLFETVQRWGTGQAGHLLSDMLEGLCSLKKNQHIIYAGVFQMGADSASFFRFTQSGIGILPTDYWLDRSHRLLAVTSMNKAYILDEKAEEVTRQLTEKARESYRSRISRGR